MGDTAGSVSSVQTCIYRCKLEFQMRRRPESDVLFTLRSGGSRRTLWKTFFGYVETQLTSDDIGLV